MYDENIAYWMSILPVLSCFLFFSHIFLSSKNSVEYFIYKIYFNPNYRSILTFRLLIMQSRGTFIFPQCSVSYGSYSQTLCLFPWLFIALSLRNVFLRIFGYLFIIYEERYLKKFMERIKIMN